MNSWEELRPAHVKIMHGPCYYIAVIAAIAALYIRSRLEPA